MGKRPTQLGSKGTTEELDLDPRLKREIERLHRLTVCCRWLFVVLLWLTVGGLSLWTLRSSITLWLEYFTWAAVRLGLRYHWFATVGLALCIGMTMSVLIWQTRNILFGLPPEERNQLIQQVLRIRKQGASHPLWQWVCGKQETS